MQVEIKGLGKITATKEVLNAIAIMAYKSSEYNKIKKRNALAELDANVHSEIYKALENAGYFKE